MFFVGTAPASQDFAIQFLGHYSSTQAKLVALQLLYRHVDPFRHLHHMIFVLNSQLALLRVGRLQCALALVVEVRIAIRTLLVWGLKVHLWWRRGSLVALSHAPFHSLSCQDRGVALPIGGFTASAPYWSLCHQCIFLSFWLSS